jgi:hypothetical protein
MFQRPVLTTICAFVLVAVVGCGSKPPAIKTRPVTGTVNLKGQPLANATVAFFPVDSGVGMSATGETDAQGHFKVQTHAGGTTFVPGAMVGEYKVTVSKTAAGTASASNMLGTDLSKMSDEQKKKQQGSAPGDSPLPGIKPGDKGPEGNKESLAVSSIVPEVYTDIKKTTLTASVKESAENTFTFNLDD